MADFANPHRDAPIQGQLLPRTVYDLGAILTLIGQGAGTIQSSDATQRQRNEKCTSSRGVRVDVKLANTSGTISVTVNIRRYIKAFNAYVTMLSSVALTGNGTTTYYVHPDLTAAANSIAKDFIGEEFDVQVVCGAGVSPSVDISVAVQMLP